MNFPQALSRTRRILPALALSLLPLAARAQAATTEHPGPQVNSYAIDPDGTAHITRVVPIPQTISPEAQKSLHLNYPEEHQTLAERRAHTDTWQNGAGEKSKAVFPVTTREITLAGVPIRDIQPIGDTHKDWVLINLHGGGFNSDSGSWTESIPVANLTHARVVAVLYRLAPEHPYPAQLDDALAVYKELLKTYKPAHIAIFGTSAGAILTGEVAVRLKQLGLPEPAALGIFSGFGDFSKRTDSDAIYTGRGLIGDLPMPGTQPHDQEYLGDHDRTDPVVSPVYADLHGLPPTLFLTSTRDQLLSGTTILNRAFLRAGVDARLIVFEALPHAFWNDVSLPESREAYGYMADFFTRQLSR